MTDTILLTLPDDVSARVRRIAEQSHQPVEQVLIEHIKTLQTASPALPPDVQSELDALRALSDDALWAIAREQMPDAAQSRADALAERSDQTGLSNAEQDELDALVERADRLMLRKAEASSLLRARGYPFAQQDYSFVGTPHRLTAPSRYRPANSVPSGLKAT